MKRSLALREFALGVEGLSRFVDGEPLYRVHECAFAVLALEKRAGRPQAVRGNMTSGPPGKALLAPRGSRRLPQINGRPATRPTCVECGTGKFRIRVLP